MTAVRFADPAWAWERPDWWDSDFPGRVDPEPEEPDDDDDDEPTPPELSPGRLPFPTGVIDRYPDMDALVARLADGCDKPRGRRSVERWITQGVPKAAADLVAIRLLHTIPELVWPEAFPPITVTDDDDDYSDLVPANERNPR